MNIDDAIYRSAHEYKGGIPALAQRMGVSQNTLQHKVNPNNSTHYCTPQQVIDIEVLTGTSHALHAHAGALDHVAIAIGNFAGVSDAALLELYARLVAELGEFSAAFNRAIADGSVTPKEYEQLQAEQYQFIQASLELMNRTRQLVRDAVPHGAIAFPVVGGGR